MKGLILLNIAEFTFLHKADRHTSRKVRYERRADIQIADFSFLEAYKKASNAQSSPECRSSVIQGTDDIESKVSVETPLVRCSRLQTYKPCHSMALPCATQF